MKNVITFFFSVLFCFYFSLEVSSQRTITPKPWCTVGDSSSTKSNGGFVKQTTNNSTARLSDPNGKIIIPVVFHIMYDPNTPQQNVSDASIDEQLRILNNDLKGQNTGSIPAPWASLRTNMGVELRRACIDPNGNATTGIIRKQMSSAGPFNYMSNPGGALLFPELQIDALGGSNSWPTDHYLNIWIGDIEPMIGMAMFPWYRFGTTDINIGGMMQTFSNQDFDGIVLDYTVVPQVPTDPNDPIPLSDHDRVLTHEVGHWLGLYHVYQGCTSPNDDMVADTPPQNHANTGCPTFWVSGGDCSQVYPGAMFMNYMDLTDSRCMRLFTHGQRARSRTYFSQSGPLGTRYPYLQNYFGIKQPFQLQNNTLTVYLNNPACLEVDYSFTGPVTEISHDNQKIVFSVACPSSGQVSVTATANNYIDDYTFSFTNSACNVEAWPKVYSGKAPEYLWYDNAGNIFMLLHEADILIPPYNHLGVLPIASQGEYCFQYSSLGYTSWEKTNIVPAFVLNSGDVQMDNFNYYNGSTGNVSTPPALVPAGQIILAESNGSFITHNFFANNLYVHATSGSTTISNANIFKSIFNPVTKKLFIERFFSNVSLDVYTLSGNTLILNSSTNFPNGTNVHFVQVDNQDRAFVIYNGVLYQFVYPQGILSPVSINGFINNNLMPIRMNNSYTDDGLLVYNSADKNIYALNLNSNSSKKIATDHFFSGFSYGFIKGDDVYLASGNDMDPSPIIIGNQTINPLDPQYSCIWVTKLSLQNDFSQRTMQYTIAPIQQQSSFNLAFFPNPASSTLKVNVLGKGKEQNEVYSLSIFDQSGNRMLRKENYQLGSELNITGLKTGIYYLEITDQFGERAGKTFMKL